VSANRAGTVPVADDVSRFGHGFARTVWSRARRTSKYLIGYLGRKKLIFTRGCGPVESIESIDELGRRWQMIFEVLSVGTRRRIIGSLIEVAPGRKLSLPEAANIPDHRIDPEALRTTLVHEHLPMMTRAGYIDWEQEPFRVWRGPRFEEAAGVILAIDDYDEFPQHLIEGCYFHDQERVGP
jgi:hypothetical protein